MGSAGMRSTLIASSLLLAACSSATRNLKESPLSPDEALVRGVESSFLSSLLLPVGVHADVVIFKVDGKKLAEPSTEVTVAPGPHVISTRCDGTVDGSIQFSGQNAVEFEAVGKHVYQLVPSFPNPSICKVSINEVMDE